MTLRTNRRPRRGTVLPLLTVCLIGLLSFVALAIDVGVIAVARTQTQEAADVAALVGARTLDGIHADNNRPQALANATAAATNNAILGQAVAPSQVTTARAAVYRYDKTAQRFQADFTTPPGTNEAWGAVQVTIQATQQTYFAKLLGIPSLNVAATATAVHRPRDVAIVLDFSTSMQYSSNTNVRGSTNGGPTAGSMNPDPAYPQFGPWSIYPSDQAPHAMMATTGYGDRGGEGHAVSNLTVTTQNGPPLVGDFLYDTGGGNYVNAFVVGDPANYNSASTPVVTPAPSNWVAQYDSSGVLAGYDGDPWPLKKGKTTANSIGDYASTAQEFITGSNSGFSNGSNGNGTFQTYGYDWNPGTGLVTAGKFKGYSMGPGYYGKTFYMWPPDPRYTTGADPTKPAAPAANKPPQDTSGRLLCDWRKRFFINLATNGPVDDNSLLWDASGNWIAATNVSNGKIAVNYPAVLAWLKSGPQTLPGNLQSGRVIYYSSIPSNVNTSGSSAVDLDKVFWKRYIDFVLGIPGNHKAPSQNDDMAHALYGQASSNSASYGGTNLTFGVTPKTVARTSLTGNSPAPYMSYTDAPVHPRLHFWFGPLTMIAFLTGPCEYSRNWNPGTSHEAHDWHLKAGIQSAIQDIKANHPNDYAALIFFSTLSQYNTARVPMGQNYTYLTNALWYPYSLIDPATGAVSGTMRPYDVNFNDRSQAILPNANGGTNPTGGFMAAYNEFSSASGYNGRRGAAKVVIFETDGVAHDYYSLSGALQNRGAYQSFYNFGSNIDEPVSSNINQASKTVAVQAVQQLCAPTTANPPGYSTARNPARVHALGFGELFEPYLTSSTTGGPMQVCAMQLLLNVQIAGGTSPSTDTIQSCWGYPGVPTAPGGAGGYTAGTQSFKIIVGDYDTRINLIRQAMERIMQSGIQVALIQ